MFNVKPASTVQGFRVNPMLDEPGFRVEAGEPARYGFVDVDGARLAGGGLTPSYAPGPGGSGNGWDKCTLMPGIEQFDSASIFVLTVPCDASPTEGHWDVSRSSFAMAALAFE